MFNRLARMAILEVCIGGNINAAGVQLAYRDTDCTGPLLQYVEVVFKGVRQGAALRSDQQQ